MEAELKTHFRPEFLNRLDETILFTPLTKEHIRSIIDLMLKGLNERLTDRQLTISLTDSAKDFIMDRAYDPIYGARPLRRYLQQNVETMAARIILQGEIREGSGIVIDVAGEELEARVTAPPEKRE
ncbi:MAG: hypothetical protein J6D14_03935 [Lachnospiraceae bacterium]|nr:hypothetical protein [Lachnospiraceae bacterium]